MTVTVSPQQYVLQVLIFMVGIRVRWRLNHGQISAWRAQIMQKRIAAWVIVCGFGSPAAVVRATTQCRQWLNFDDEQSWLVIDWSRRSAGATEVAE